MRTGLAWMLALTLVAFSIAVFSGASCTDDSEDATNCTASYPQDAGPTAACAISFTCDVGVYDMTCSLDPAGNFQCQCGTDQTTTGTRFNSNSFKCTAEGAIVAANMGCGWDLSLPQ